MYSLHTSKLCGHQHQEGREGSNVLLSTHWEMGRAWGGAPSQLAYESKTFSEDEIRDFLTVKTKREANVDRSGRVRCHTPTSV